jgi:PASTA domain
VSPSPTEVQPPRPAPDPVRVHGRRPKPSWVLVALAGALGFTAGIVLAVGAGAGSDTKTVTVTHTAAPPAKTAPAAPPTVITKVSVPDLANVRLDVAKNQIHAQGWHVKVKGGGFFGVIVDSNWTVVAQDPKAGTLLQRGGTITVDVVK